MKAILPRAYSEHVREEACQIGWHLPPISPRKIQLKSWKRLPAQSPSTYQENAILYNSRKARPDRWSHLPSNASKSHWETEGARRNSRLPSLDD
jgi:hypothetical protein